MITHPPHVATSLAARTHATPDFLERAEFEETVYSSDSGHWSLFYDRYPNSYGYISLSPVGFNNAGDEAFLFASRTCGFLCAEGWHVLLRKGPDGWRIIRRDLAWVS
jgi:hypothetical protein